MVNWHPSNGTIWHPFDGAGLLINSWIYWCYNLIPIIDSNFQQDVLENIYFFSEGHIVWFIFHVHPEIPKQDLSTTPSFHLLEALVELTLEERNDFFSAETKHTKTTAIFFSAKTAPGFILQKVKGRGYSPYSIVSQSYLVRVNTWQPFPGGISPLMWEPTL